MLDYLRKRSKSFLIVFCVVALCLVFVIQFGRQALGWQSCEGSDFTIARVYNHEITKSEFISAVRFINSRYRFREEYAESKYFRKAILDGLIERELLIREADKMGLSVSNDDVISSVVDNLSIYFSWPAEDYAQVPNPAKIYDFTDEEGNFLAEDFEQFINHLGMGLKGFNEQQRRELLAQKVREIVLNNIVIAPDEIREAYDRSNTKVNLAFIRFWPQYFGDRLEPSVNDLTSWASSHSKEVEDYYKANRFRYAKLPEQIKINHILISLPAEATEEERTKARTKADAILNLAQQGTNFALLARCYSEDEQSSSQGGDLGYLRKGSGLWGEQFYDAVFSIEPGTIAGPIESSKGFHIVKVIDKRQGDITLDKATLEISELLYRKNHGKELAKSLATQVLEKIRSGAELDDQLLQNYPELTPDKCPAYEQGAEETSPIPSRFAPLVTDTDWFTPISTGIPHIGEAPQIKGLAFTLTKEHPIPEKIVELQDSFFVVKLRDREDPTDEGFNSERQEILVTLLDLKQQSSISSYVARLRAEAEKHGEITINEDILEPPQKQEKARQGVQEDEGESEGEAEKGKGSNPPPRSLPGGPSEGEKE